MRPGKKKAVAYRAAVLFGGLGQAHHRDFGQVEFLEGLKDHVELAPAAVHHQEVGQFLPRLAVVPLDHFPEHGVIVLAFHLPDLEAAVAGFVRDPVGKGRQRPHRLAPLEGGDIQALQPGRELRQLQACLQVAEGGPGVRGGPAAPEGVPGIVRGQGQQPGPVAPGGHQQAQLWRPFPR